MRTGFRKKVTAVFAAGAVALAGLVPLTASAAYVDTERANWAALADDYGVLWDEAMAESQESETGSGELKLEFGDLVRTIIGSIFATSDGEPMDFSWLESIAIRVAAAKEDANVLKTALGLCLNDTLLASLELPIDLGNDTVKFRVPELSSNYLGAPFEFETDEMRQQWQYFKEVVNPEFLAELAASGDEVAELLKRYGDILFDHMTDCETEEKTETMADVEQTFTVEEGRIYAVDLAHVILEMAKQARDDEILKEMIEDLGTFSQQEDLYEEYQRAIDETIRDMEEDMPGLDRFDEEDYISARVWLDEDGKCAGREFSLIAEGKQRAQLTWLNVREGDQAALRMYCITDDWLNDGSSVLSGVGTITDGRLDGEYMVTQNGLPQCRIEVSDYDVDAASGDLEGTYKLTYAGETDDSQNSFSLEDYALILDVEERAKEKINNVSLSLMMNDELIAALHIKDGAGEELLTGSGADDGILYDANDQEDLQKYVEEVDPETIIENCRKAGVPEEFIEQVAGLVTQMTEADHAGDSETSELSQTPEASGAL